MLTRIYSKEEVIYVYDRQQNVSKTGSNGRNSTAAVVFCPYGRFPSSLTPS